MSRTTVSAALVLVCFASLPSPSLAARGELPVGARVGLTPLLLPDGPRAFNDRLASQLSAQLKDGAASFPRLHSLELISRGACLPDEGGCLGAEAMSQKLHGIVAGRVTQSDRGFGFELRLFAADGRELSIQRGTVEGGPLDLASGLENGLCELLGATPCVGTLSISSDNLTGESATALEKPIFIDNKAAGPLISASQLALAVGRHLVRVGKSERRVRVAFHRETKLVCGEQDGAVALELAPGESGQFVAAGQGDPSSASTSASSAASSSSPAPAPAIASAARATAPVPPDALVPGSPATEAAPSTRTQAGRLLLVAGGALAMSAVGIEIYTQAQSGELNTRYQSGQLTAADAPTYGKVHTAGVTALVLGALGAGAFAAGGLVLLLSPNGAAVQGKF